MVRLVDMDRPQTPVNGQLRTRTDAKISASAHL